MKNTETKKNGGEIPSGNHRCVRCTKCNFTQKTRTFNHPRTGKTHTIKAIITCNTINVVYMLKCPCRLAYIGKTSRPLKNRISEHRSNIWNNDSKSAVAVHFSQAHHNVNMLQFVDIEQIKMSNRDANALLLRREAFWIYTLNTVSPRGLNEEFDLSYDLCFSTDIYTPVVVFFYSDVPPLQCSCHFCIILYPRVSLL